MKRLRFRHHGHLPINLIMLRVLKLWNPFVRSLLTFNPLQHSHQGGMLFYLTYSKQLYMNSTHFGILIEGPFRMSFRASRFNVYLLE
jgi:hypothetical protein